MPAINPSADTYIASSGGNYGTSDYLIAGHITPIATPVNTRILLRFDLSTYDPEDIGSAILRLSLFSAIFPEGTHEVYVHELTTAAWTSAAATWTAASGVLNWTTVGGDFASTPDVTTTIENGDTELFLDLTELARDNSGGNLDILIKLVDADGDLTEHDFAAYSFDYATAGNRPQLTITSFPVVERISREIKRRLEQVTSLNGYARTFAVVRVPARGGDDLCNGKCFLEQAPEARKIGQTDGSPNAVEWQQEFIVTIHVAAADDDDTPVDTAANQAAADAEWAITHEQLSGDWAQFESLAMDCEQVGRSISNDGATRTIELTYAVTYRTSENDPYTVR
jgi:hypothetical protein